MKIKPKIQESKPKIQSEPEIQRKARAGGGHVGVIVIFAEEKLRDWIAHCISMV
jgi:hypothetical protein